VTDQIVHVVDDDDAVRASLAFVLESAGRKALTYASAEEFLEACGPDMIGCVITDVRMAEINGIELVRRLQMLGVTMPVIVMTGHGDVSLAVEAMKAGVLDFLEKPFDDEVFLRAVEAALNSGVRTAHEDADRRRFQSMLATLSPRETEVLHGVVEGKSNKEIARDLGISPRTVEVYRAHVMSKTSSSSLSDLVRIALLAGF
jgi:two-component system, LuxR family, response regulator FixJ